MIVDISTYFINKSILDRSYQAVSDKSWDVCGIDKERIFAELELNYPFIWLQLLMKDAFGLRRKEAISLRPYLAEKNGHLYITVGGKGGKSRIIKIEDEYQQLVIQKAITFVDKKAIHIGGTETNLKKNMRKFSNVVHRLGIKKTGKGALGVTAHGLRAGFAMRQMMLKGLVPYIKGGRIGEIDKAKELEIRREVSMLLGHNRIQVTTAYSGPQTQKGVWLLDKYLAAKLSVAIQALEAGETYRFTLIDQINEKGIIDSTIDVVRKFQCLAKEGELFILVLEDSKGIQEQLYITVITRIEKC